MSLRTYQPLSGRASDKHPEVSSTEAAPPRRLVGDRGANDSPLNLDVDVPESMLRVHVCAGATPIDASAGDRFARIRDELEALRYLHCADTSALESALCDAELVLPVVAVGQRDAGTTRLQVRLIPGMGGDFLPCLPTFTGLDRFEAWRGARNAIPRRLPAIACWAIAVRSGCSGVGIDPGHATEFKFSLGGLRRLIRRSLERQIAQR